MIRPRSGAAVCLLLGLLLVAGGVLAAGAASAPQAADDDEALKLYYSANALFNRKLHALALEEYEAFLRTSPGHEKAPQARLGQALCLYALDRKADAAPLLAELARDRGLSNQQEIHNLWGQCLLAIDDPAGAERAFAWSAANGNDPAQATLARVGRIEALYRLSRWPEVIDEADRFLGRESAGEHAERVSFQAAVARFELGRYAEAGALLEKLNDPGEKTAFMQHVVFLFAECRRELGDADQAVALFEQCGRDMQGAFTAEALYRAAFIRFRRGEHERAAADLAHFLDRYPAAPSAAPARLYLGRCHLELRRYREAEKAFSVFKAGDAEYPEAQLWLARTMKQQAKWAEAERALAAGLKAPGPDAARGEMLFELADVRREQGRYGEAAEGFRQAGAELSKTAGPGTAAASGEASAPGEALRLEAYCLHKAGSHAESLARCDEYLSRYPQSDRRADAAFIKAESLFLMDRLKEAEPVYAAFLAEFPEHYYAAYARFRIAQLLYYGRKWQAAVDALARVGTEQDAGAPFFAQRDYIVGDCHFHLEQWDEAGAAFARFAAAQPGAANRDAALFKAALAAVHAGRTAEAAAALESFLASNPKSAYAPEARVELGRLRYEAGDFRAARRDLVRAAREGDDPRGHYYLGYAAAAEGDEEQALQHFKDLEARHPDHELAADALLQQAVLHVRRGELEAAQAACERLIASKEHAARLAAAGKADQPPFYLAIALARQAQWEPAAARFREVQQQHPESPLRDRAIYELAWCEKALGRRDRAAELYAELIRAYPESALAPHARFEAAELACEEGQYARAAEGFRALSGEDADPVLRERALYRLGWCAFSAGDMAEAARAFEELLAAFPACGDAAAARYQAGEARLSLKEYEQAYGHFHALADLRPAAAAESAKIAEQGLLRLAECAGLTQRWQESQNLYDRFIKLYPESAFIDQARFGMAWAIENRGLYTDAIAAYEAVLGAGRQNAGRDTRREICARSQFQIGECYFALKRYDDAVKALIKVEVMYAFPQWGSKALLEVGRALEISGRESDALDRYREVVAKYPDSDAAAVAREKLDNLKEG